MPTGSKELLAKFGQCRDWGGQGEGQRKVNQEGWRVDLWVDWPREAAGIGLWHIGRIQTHVPVSVSPTWVSQSSVSDFAGAALRRPIGMARAFLRVGGHKSPYS